MNFWYIKPLSLPAQKYMCYFDGEIIKVKTSSLEYNPDMFQVEYWVKVDLFSIPFIPDIPFLNYYTVYITLSYPKELFKISALWWEEYRDINVLDSQQRIFDGFGTSFPEYILEEWYTLNGIKFQNTPYLIGIGSGSPDNLSTYIDNWCGTKYYSYPLLPHIFLCIILCTCIIIWFKKGSRVVD